MALSEFIRPPTHGDATIAVLNPEHESPIYTLLEKLLSSESITITETIEEGAPSDAVLVERSADRSAVSPLEAIEDELLLVNSDIYVTGTRKLEAVNTPDVIENLDELRFTIAGYPDNPLEKLLFIEISRHIEAMAWRAGEGNLKTGFQYLSRVNHERGTRRVYERLGSTDITTHIYGVPDAEPSIPGVTAHGTTASEIEQTWFVIYQSDQHPNEAAGLVAVETAPNIWEGSWTYDPDRVAAMCAYLDSSYPIDQ